MIQTLTRKYKENLVWYSLFLNYSTIKFHKKKFDQKGHIFHIKLSRNRGQYINHKRYTRRYIFFH